MINTMQDLEMFSQFNNSSKEISAIGGRGSIFSVFNVNFTLALNHLPIIQKQTEERTGFANNITD